MTVWREITLGEVVTLQRGFDLTEKEAIPGPFPVISSGGSNYTTDCAKVEGPGVITGRKGVLGKVHWSEGPFWPHDTTLWVKDFKGSDPRFVYYLLQTLPLASLDAGAANPTLNRNHAHLLPIRVPDQKTQLAIANALRAFDDLIENNRRRIEALEEMARAIYREWFVRFRYPGRGDLRLVDSVLGPIPEGWHVGKLGDLADEVRDSVQPSDKTRAIPYVPIDEIDKRSLTLHRSRSGDDAASSLRLFREGDILFGAMRAYFHKVCVAPFDGVTRSTCFVLRGRPAWRTLPVFYLDDDESVAYASNHSSGSTIPYAKWEGVLSERKVALPQTELAHAFSDAAGPMLAQAQILAKQAAELASLRDLLLPKLVTGQIDVSKLDLDPLVEDRVA